MSNKSLNSKHIFSPVTVFPQEMSQTCFVFWDYKSSTLSTNTPKDRKSSGEKGGTVGVVLFTPNGCTHKLSCMSSQVTKIVLVFLFWSGLSFHCCHGCKRHSWLLQHRMMEHFYLFNCSFSPPLLRVNIHFLASTIVSQSVATETRELYSLI